MPPAPCGPQAPSAAMSTGMPCVRRYTSSVRSIENVFIHAAYSRGRTLRACAFSFAASPSRFMSDRHVGSHEATTSKPLSRRVRRSLANSSTLPEDHGDRLSRAMSGCAAASSVSTMPPMRLRTSLAEHPSTSSSTATPRPGSLRTSSTYWMRSAVLPNPAGATTRTMPASRAERTTSRIRSSRRTVKLAPMGNRCGAAKPSPRPPPTTSPDATRTTDAASGTVRTARARASSTISNPPTTGPPSLGPSTIRTERGRIPQFFVESDPGFRLRSDSFRTR